MATIVLPALLLQATSHGSPDKSEQGLAPRMPAEFDLTIDLPPDEAWTEIGEPSDKVDVCVLLHSSMASNFEKLRSWTADFDRYRSNLYEDVAIKMASSGDFAIDFRTIRYFWSFEPKGFLQKSLDGGVTWVSTEDDREYALYSAERVVTSNFFLEFEQRPYCGRPTEIKGFDPEGRRIARHRPLIKLTVSPFLELGDPRFFFGANVEKRYWEFLDRVATSYRDESDPKLRKKLDEGYSFHQAEHHGNTWYKVVRGSPARGAESVHYFDEGAGFNLVEKTDIQNGKIQSLTSWEYGEVDGVIVPSKWSVQYDWRKARQVYLFRNQKVNAPISEAQFTQEALSLKQDDLLMNDIEKVAYTVDGGKLVKICNYGEAPPPEVALVEERSAVPWVLSSIGLAVIALALLMSMIRRKSASENA